MKSSGKLELKCGSAIALTTLMLFASTSHSIAAPGQGDPTKIAVFGFELEDMLGARAKQLNSSN